MEGILKETDDAAHPLIKYCAEYDNFYTCIQPLKANLFPKNQVILILLGLMQSVHSSHIVKVLFVGMSFQSVHRSVHLSRVLSFC